MTNYLRFVLHHERQALKHEVWSMENFAIKLL